ncbi:DUF7452 domain-containing protein [Deinococcus marmoris]|uniref:DUF7452 domain-containing protein n=1 Tax=Deinococcus marmoris TaxID=249408 RepID=A0A1U7NS67_9DEIO|nr:hypothetical protein [Deinococcus marmoris]OLV15761.1 hypothetical protein BOO71_0013903 [Deinococcus marmoris]
MKKLLTLTALTAALSAPALAALYTVPNTFTAGSAIKAADMNTNFQSAQTELRRLDTKVVAFIHTSTATNITSNWTCIDNPASNSTPTALVFVTPNYSPPSPTPSGYVPYPIGVWYTTSKWCIFYQDTTKIMPAGLSFNVMVTKP